MERFRAGLPARLRGHVEHGVLRGEGDGVALLLPHDDEIARELVEGHRFHLMAAAAEAFGRPVPVAVRLDHDLLESSPQPGDIEGTELGSRRLVKRASRSSLVEAVVSRFDGRILGVVTDGAPDDATNDSSRGRG
jgi:hypothetical protein